MRFFSAAFLFVIGLTSAQPVTYSRAPISNEVTELATEYGQAISRTTGNNVFPQLVQGQLRFFDDTSVVQVYSELPFGGTYQGLDQIKRMYKRFSLSMEVTRQNFQLLGVNEAEGMAMLEVDILGTFKRTGKQAQLKLIMALEVDPVQKKILSLIVVNKNKAQAIRAFSTPAETLLQNLIKMAFQSDYEQLVAGTAPFWNLVSNNIKVKANMYPESQELFGQSEWNGKQALIEHMKDVKELDYAFIKQMPKLLAETTSKVLFSDDDDVWVKFEWPGYGDGMIKHYKFDNQGKLAEEEITLLKALKPWQVFPAPFSGEQAQDKNQKQQQPYGNAKTELAKEFGNGGLLDFLQKKIKLGNTMHTGNIEKLNQVGLMKIGPVHYTKIETEFDMDMHMNKDKQNMLKKGMTVQAEWKSPGGIITGSGFDATTFNPDKQIQYCDSTQNQICMNGTPCKAELLTCLTPQQCLCP